MKKMIKDTVIEIIDGDITEMETDAIVNAANENLIHGGGVAGAIVRKGGKIIQQESNEWIRKHGRVLTGSTAITGGGNLKAKFVIHAVGPVMGRGDEDSKLRNVTISCLKLADENNIESIAFPAISTGIFGYPLGRCAQVMISAVEHYLNSTETNIGHIIFCLWGHDAFQTFKKEIERIG